MHSFAIIPAAGRSRRMGAPKLLLPWGEKTIIEAVLAAWLNSRVTTLVAVADGRDEQLIDVIRQTSEELQDGGRIELVIAAAPPPQMKDSIRLALAHIEARHQPAADDVWLLAPADMPTLSPRVIDRLLGEVNTNGGQILVPTHGLADRPGRRGHPVLFPWRFAAEVAALGDDEGVNQLLKRHPVVEIGCGNDCLAGDIDTAGDYARLRAGDAGIDRD